MKTKYVECECQSFDHIARWVWFESDHHPWADDELYLDYNLNHYLPWWKRIWVALTYICKEEYIGRYDCLILNREKAVELRDFLNKRLGENE